MGRTDVLVFTAFVTGAVIAFLGHHIGVGLMGVVDSEAHILEFYEHNETAHLALGRESEV